MKTLIIDNNIDRPWSLCPDFRRYLEGTVEVRRAPQGDLPSKVEGYSHIIITGSKTSTLDSSPWITQLMAFVSQAIESGIPTLGICYGHQIIAKIFGGQSVVRASRTPEIGWVEIRQTKPNPVLEGLPTRFYTFESHVEEVVHAPKGFVATAESERCAIQAYYAKGKPVFGVQFHPEKNAEEGQASIQRRFAEAALKG